MENDENENSTDIKASIRLINKVGELLRREIELLFKNRTKIVSESCKAILYNYLS